MGMNGVFGKGYIKDTFKGNSVMAISMRPDGLYDIGFSVTPPATGNAVAVYNGVDEQKVRPAIGIGRLLGHLNRGHIPIEDVSRFMLKHEYAAQVEEMEPAEAF